MKTRTLASSLSIALVASALAAGCSSAPSSKGSTANPSGEKDAQVAPVKDEHAMAELKKMSDALSSAKTLSFNSMSITPIRGPNHQWLHVLATAKVDLQRPNRLFIETGGDAFPQRIYFDGKDFSVSAAASKLYTQAPMQGDVDSMLAQASAKAGDAFSFSDVLLSNPMTSWSKDLEGATYVGESVRGKEKLEHFAMTAKDVHWEAWVDGKDHLPRMVYVKYTDLPHSPSVLIEFSNWKRNAKIPASTFVFHAPAGAKKAELKAPGKSVP